jgi:nucleotide-binding universal stress UspA family protein
MKTILVPTDFSSVAFNAATYAIHLAQQLMVPQIVLYHAYELPMVIGSEMLAPAALVEPSQLEKDVRTNLENLKDALINATNTPIVIHVHAEINMLPFGISQYAQKYGISLVVMGITGGGLLEEKLIGSTSLQVAEICSIPVLIVPKYSIFKTIRKAVLCSDDQQSLHNTYIKMNKVLGKAGIDLAVVHVNSTEKDAPYVLDASLKVLYHVNKIDVVTLVNQSFQQAVNGYVKNTESDMLILIAKKHKWYQHWFTEGHAQQMAYHTNIPMLLINEQ